MALRVNAQAKEKDIDILLVRSEDSSDDGGIDYGQNLVKFVDAFMTRDPEILSQAREDLCQSMGPAGMVDAAAVAGNFQRMVRIADCIGIPVDESRMEMTAGLREELHLNEFHSAENTFKHNQ